MKVYLAGPINGCTDVEAKDWREYAKSRLSDTLDPMRRDYRGLEDANVKEIVENDKDDIDQAAVILANCPKPSVGTSMEILYAWLQHKTIVVVAPRPMSPWLVYHSTWRGESLREAVDFIAGGAI